MRYLLFLLMFCPAVGLAQGAPSGAAGPRDIASERAAGAVRDAAAPPRVGPPPASWPRPPVRRQPLPPMRWSHKEDRVLWNRAALSALRTHGRALTATVPRDIGAWCPRYAVATQEQRRAFWVGLMSALAKHESTFKQRAVGGGGRWYGLLQILPSTARGYNCVAGTGEALKSGAANLSCAIRIMARTVPRDGVIAAREGRWKGVAADWGPMRSSAKRREMSDWLKAQPYCDMPATPLASARPRMRPEVLAQQ